MVKLACLSESKSYVGGGLYPWWATKSDWSRVIIRQPWFVLVGGLGEGQSPHTVKIKEITDTGNYFPALIYTLRGEKCLMMMIMIRTRKAKSCNLSGMAGLTGLVNQISRIYKIVRKWRNVDLTTRSS